MRFLLLAVKFFYSGIQRNVLTDPIQEGVIPSKKSSRRLVDKEIFFTHKAKLCFLICIKCIVIYHKMEGEGLPSKRSFLRLVANETKKYLFEGSPCPCILSPLNQLVCLLAPWGVGCYPTPRVQAGRPTD